MQLELNLLKVDNIYSVAGQIISRKRSVIKDDADAMVAIIDFISTNLDYINAVVTNKELVNKLSMLKALTTDEFNGINYLLAESGLIITYYMVSDVEINSDGVPAESLEYNVIDKMNYFTAFIPFCTKINVNKDEYTTSALYEKIVNMYGLFMDDVFSGVNPLMSDIKVMNEAEQLVGTAPEGVITHANTVLDFLGKQIRVIHN